MTDVERLRAELARVTAERDAAQAELAALRPTTRWTIAGSTTPPTIASAATSTHAGMTINYREGHT